MSLLLETIKCKDGKLYNLPFHQVRFNLARNYHFSSLKKICLAETIKIPGECKTGLFRCRVIYREIILKIEFIPHVYRPVRSLKLVEDNEITYPFKYIDRERLHSLFEQRGDCDDILIVKNGCISDSFTANTVFFDGHRWWTPDTPLLPGTQRARLLHEKKILECRISRTDFPKYQTVGLINTMQDMKNMPVIPIKNIFTSHIEF